MQDTKTNNICKDHNRHIPNGGDCPLCHDAGIKTEVKKTANTTKKTVEVLRNLARRDTMTNEFEPKDHIAWEAANEIERLHGWLRYISGNFRNGEECAEEALNGDPLPEGFEG